MTLALVRSEGERRLVRGRGSALERCQPIIKFDRLGHSILAGNHNSNIGATGSVKRFPAGQFREFRQIVDPAEMRQYDTFDRRAEIIAKKARQRFIRQVTTRASDASLCG